jgi:hypothetical protein
LDVLLAFFEVGEVSPLHLVPKKGSKPFRTIHDISVGNTVLPDAPFRIETLKDVQDICGKGYFCATIDYSSAFWNVRVSPRTSKYLGFAWAGRLFTWVCLPFGLKTSPFVFSFVSLQVVKQLRSEGILIVFYQDDLFLCHPTKAGCELSVLRALSLLDRLNVRVSWDKSSLLPSQRVIYLGLWVDAFQGCFEVPSAKVLVAKELIAQALKNSSIPVRDLARIAGMLQAMSLALPLVHSALASSYRLIAQSDSWSSDILLSPDVLSDFHLILLFLDSWNGVASWRSTREVVVIGSDGSPHRYGAWKADLVGGPTLLHSLAWSELDKPRSQNWHELQSAYRALLAFSKFISHTRVFLFLDSRTAICYCLNGGGYVPALAKIARKIWKLCVALDVDLQVRWVPGTRHLLADHLSRVRDPSDWKLNPHFFRMIQVHFNLVFSVDRMATSLNKQCKRFNSFLYDKGQEGVDCFSQDWSGECNWVNPDFSQIGRVLAYIRKSNCLAVVVLPMWPAQAWWPLAHSLCSSFLPLPSVPDLFLSVHGGAVGAPSWECAAFLFEPHV